MIKFIIGILVGMSMVVVEAQITAKQTELPIVGDVMMNIDGYVWAKFPKGYVPDVHCIQEDKK